MIWRTLALKVWLLGNFFFCLFWWSFFVCLGSGFFFLLLLFYVLLQKNNQFLSSEAHDATATSPGLESSASYEMYDTVPVSLSLRDFHLTFPCRLLCAWLVVRRDLFLTHGNLDFLPFHLLGGKWNKLQADSPPNHNSWKLYALVGMFVFYFSSLLW